MTQTASSRFVFRFPQAPAARSGKPPFPQAGRRARWLVSGFASAALVAGSCLAPATLQAHEVANEPASLPLVGDGQKGAEGGPREPAATAPPDSAASPSAAGGEPAVVQPETLSVQPWSPLKVIYSRTSLSGNVTKDRMDGLRVVSQGSTNGAVAAQIGLNLALMVLAGGPAFNVQGFSKEDLAGSEPEDAVDLQRLRNPALEALPQEVERRAAVWLASRPASLQKVYALPLVLNSASWRLIYNSLDTADTTYRLTLDVQVYQEQRRNFFRPPKLPGKGCRFVSEARPLADWKANDYQAVVDLAPKAVDTCAGAIVAQLPALLNGR